MSQVCTCFSLQGAGTVREAVSRRSYSCSALLWASKDKAKAIPGPSSGAHYRRDFRPKLVGPGGPGLGKPADPADTRLPSSAPGLCSPGSDAGQQPALRKVCPVHPRTFSFFGHSNAMWADVVLQVSAKSSLGPAAPPPPAPCGPSFSSHLGTF